MPDYRDRYTDEYNSRQPARRPASDGQPMRRPANDGQPMCRPASDGQPMRRSVNDGQPVRRPASDGQPMRRSANDGQPVRRSASDGQPVRRPASDGQPVRRPANDGQPVRRPASDGQPMRRPANDGQPVRRPANDGQPVRRPANDGQPVRRPVSGNGQSTRRPAGQPPRRPAQGANAGARRPSSADSRFSKAGRRSPKKEASFKLPQWARLGVIAVAFMVLIGLSVKAIGSLTERDDRTVITPVSNATNTVTPDGTAVLSADATSTDATADPAQNATDAPAATDVPAAATDTPAAQPVSGGRSATIRMAGDIVIDTEMLDACYDKASDSYDFAPYFSMIGDTLSKSDYTMINIDASLRKGKYGYSGYPQFTTPPVILQVVKNVGVDMITMCNNHMLDGYCDGLVESVGHVEAAGLDHIGGFVDEADSKTPEVYTINGIRVGFVCYTHSTNTMEDHCDERSKFLVKRFKNADFKADVDAARAAGAEVVVAVAHWGDEYHREPDSDQQYWAKKLVAAGVDLIIGGHPHMVQPAEYITATDANGVSHTALCVYSIGNFLTQHRSQYTDSGIVFEFTLAEQADGTIAVTAPGYVPVYVWTFKNAAGADDYRVLPTGVYMNNRPDGMSDEQYNRMRETWNETTSLMGGDAVLRTLTD